MSTCRYGGRTNPRYLPGRHDDECKGEPCPGCLPCPKTHCPVCGVAHTPRSQANPETTVPGTCPKCLASVRADLSDIPRLMAGLPAQAVLGAERGRLEAARPIPGGDALVLLSPASDARARVWAKERGDDVTHRLDESPVDPVPPLLILATWEDDWRQVFDHDRGSARPTIGTCLAYLDRHLTMAAGTHVAFPEFVTDIRGIRRGLENVLKDGDRDDPAGIACFDCGGQLVRRMTDSGMADNWTCRRCRRRYTDPEYHLAVRAKIEGIGA